MGIQISTKTNMKETLKLLNHITTYLFEQECMELKQFKPTQKEKLKSVCRMLSKIIKNGQLH